MKTWTFNEIMKYERDVSSDLNIYDWKIDSEQIT